MDDKKPKASLFTTNSETFDFSENQSFYRSKEWEYEKRSISSLLVGSAGGISLTLAYISSSEISTVGKIGSIIAIGFFTLSLLLTGLSQFVLNEAASQYFHYYTTMRNKQNCEASVSQHDKLNFLNELVSKVVPAIKVDKEKSSDTKFEISDKINVLHRQSVEFKERAEELQNTASKFLTSSSVLFLIGVIVSISYVLGSAWQT